MRDREIVRSILEEPFTPEQIKRRSGGSGQQFDYVPGEVVIRRLIDATDGEWDLHIRDITEKEVIVKGRNGEVLRVDTQVLARVALTIPGMGTREHIGVQTVSERGGEDLIKGAITDALKKAATLFGVALHLYEDDAPAPQQRREPGRQTEPPPAQGSRSQPPPKQRPPARQTTQVGQQAAATAQGEMDWTAFWKWARENGLPNREAVEAKLGRPMGSDAPARLHALLSGGDAEAVGGGITDRQTEFLWREADKQFGHQAAEVVHAICVMDYQVKSSDLLTRAQASALIDYITTNDPAKVMAEVGVMPRDPVPASG